MDIWHKAELAPGEVPCRDCRGAATAPTAKHGQGMRWAATWDEVVNGKRVQRSLRFRTRAEADTVQRQMREAAGDRRLPPAATLRRRGVITVAGWFPRFMELTRTERSAGTNDKLEIYFRKSVGPHLGIRDLAELQHDVTAIRVWQDALLAEGYSYGSVEERFRLLGAMFRHAMGDPGTGVSVNPCLHPQARPRKADRKRGKREMGWAAASIAAAYLAETPKGRGHRGSEPVWPRYRTMLLLSATTGGMRLGEVTGLAEDDVDWTARTITMRVSLARNSQTGVMYFRDGKSQAAQRVMTASDLSLRALALHMEQFRPVTVTLPMETAEVYGQPPETWPVVTRRLMFSTGRGTLVSGPCFQSAIRYGLNRAGLLPARPIDPAWKRDPVSGRYADNGGSQRPHHVSQRYERPTDHGVNDHALRSYWISLMLSRGVPLSVVKDEAGHEITASLTGGAGRDVTHDAYSRPFAADRKRIREIITAEFGPHLPMLLTEAEQTA